MKEIKFTFDNVYENRQAFELACKEARACEEEYLKLISAKSKEEFLDVIYRNFGWVYDRVTNFGLRYKFVNHFYGGFVFVQFKGKYGFINQDGKEICEIKYDAVWNFKDGFAKVELNGHYGYIDTEGNYFDNLEHV